MKTQKKTRFQDEIRKVLIFHALAPIALITVLFLIILGFIWSHNMIEGSRTACRKTAAQMEAVGEAYLSELSDLAQTIDLSRFGTEPDYQVETNSRIYQFLNRQEIRGIFFMIDKEERLVFCSGADLYFQQKLMEEIKWRFLHYNGLKSGEPILLLCQFEYLGNEDAVLLFGQTLESENGTDGYLCFVLPTSEFQKEAEGGAASTLVVNRFDRIFWENGGHFHDERGKLAAEFRRQEGFVSREGMQYYLTSEEVLDGELKVCAVIESGSMFRTILLLGLLVLMIFAAMTVAVFLSARRISARKTKIIDEIVEAFKNVEQGNLETRLHVSTNDEFEVIGSAYNMMIDSIRNLIQRNEEQARQTVYFNLCQLQSQFNPHFLFNTLENVRFMMKLDANAASRMILCLSSLLRYSISGGTETVTLCEDSDYIRNYLTILSYRFGERFQYSINIPEELLDAEIPRLIFQPVIENSVKYGMDAVERILVEISAVRQDGTLILTMDDNGPGIPADRLKQIQETMREPTTGGGHIGLYNVNRRLVLMYGAEYGMELSSTEGKGTRVVMRIPLRFREKSQEKGEDLC